jgi:hypothetical protein
LGHELEPDHRCRESKPLFVEVGLSALHETGCKDAELALAICSFLESVADDQGLVAPFLESALIAPHAPHWRGPTTPGLNPTTGICGLLHYQGVSHPWLARATASCCGFLLDEPPSEGHTLLSATRLIDHLPDREMANRLTDVIADSLPSAGSFIADAPVTGYGLTPLHFAPTPSSPWRRLFTNAQIDGHLDDLLARQEEDGGWPISWNAPGPASVLEWRGRLTLDAVTVLAAYGKIQS